MILSAPVGQTDAQAVLQFPQSRCWKHWPPNRLNRVSKPRPAKSSAPFPIRRQVQTHLPHIMHLLRSKRRSVWLSSIGKLGINGRSLFCLRVIPSRWAKSCSPQFLSLGQCAQSTRWLVIIKAKAARRARLTRDELVNTWMPSLTGSEQAAARPGRPAISTRQSRQEEMAGSAFRMAQRDGMNISLSRAAQRMGFPGTARIGLPSMTRLIMAIFPAEADETKETGYALGVTNLTRGDSIGYIAQWDFNYLDFICIFSSELLW